MNSKVVSLFSFEELQNSVQKNVLDKFRYINVDDHGLWNEDVYSRWKTKLAGLGYENIEILHSGFGSQGDGACFTANVDVEKWLKAHQRKDLLSQVKNVIGEISIVIKHSWRYYYASSTTVECDFMGNDIEQTAVDNMLGLIEQEREKLGNSIYKELSDLFFELVSDKSVKDALDANNYEFLSNGYMLGNVQ